MIESNVMQRIFFIGDIHGCIKTFKKLITEEIVIGKSDQIYCIGDYIDRGSDSKGVVDFILELRNSNYQIYTLRGNHEQMLLDSRNSRQAFSLWLMNGGDTTLRDFNVESVDEMDPVYIDFFSNTEYYIHKDDFVAVHAGLNFNADDPFEDKHSMLWIRGFQVSRSFPRSKLLIHGHTPMNGDLIRSQGFESPFNIDGGCVYNHFDGLGSLFALNFYEQKLLEVRNIE